jgi:DNA primase
LAGSIPEEKITEIKNLADIVDIVSETVVLKKAGKYFVGLCPFHAEKTPSFTVSPDKQIFHCFGCGEGGTVFSFLIKQTGCTFPEAVRQLASRYGIELPERGEGRTAVTSERERLLGINQLAADFFRRELETGPEGPRARDYLAGRGFKADTLKAFQVGYAPSQWDRLARHLTGQRLPESLMLASGLVLPRRSGRGCFDRFRERVIFPISDAGGRVIGFGGRIIGEGSPKYLNTPETAVYSKSRSLFGLHLARPHCRSNNEVYIVEGYLDLIALHQHGIRNAVATLGTALTADHVRLIKGMVGEHGRTLLLFDSDEAGIRAARRSIGVFAAEFVDARYGVLPSGYDPDTFVFEFGAERMAAEAGAAKAALPFLLDRAVGTHGLSNEGRIRILADLAEPLAAISDPVARSLYIREVAERTAVEEAAVLEKVRRLVDQRVPPRARQGAPASPQPGARPTMSNVSPGDRLERQLVMMMLQCPETLPEVERCRLVDLLENEALKGIAEAMINLGRGRAFEVSDLVAAMGDPRQRQLISALAMQAEEWDPRGCMRLIRHFVDRQGRQRHQRLEAQIAEAEQARDQQRLERLLAQKQQLAVEQNRRKMMIHDGDT